MKTKKRFLAVVLAAALLVAGLTGCKDALRGVAQKISGSSGEVQEEDTTRWADATADPLIIQGIADASAKFDTAMVDGTLYAVFNGIWSRQTNYFAAPTGTLTVMACGTAEGTQKFKVALWKKVDGGVEYVPDSTYYIKTDGTDYTCTISGLDPAAIYRMTISYDSSRYYLYGLLKVEGVADEYTTQEFAFAAAVRIYLGHGLRGPERRFRHGSLQLSGRAQLAGGAGAAAHGQGV